MRNCIKILFFTFIFSLSCKQIYHNKTYCEALSEYIKENKIDSNFLIINEFIKLKAWSPKLELYINEKDTVYIPEPPPIHSEIEVITKESLEILAKNEVIDSNEIEYIFNHLESTSKLECPFFDLHVRSISLEEFVKYKNNIDGDEIFNRLEKDFKIRSYMIFSQPIFTKNHEVVIFSSNLYCGSLCGIGHKIAMKCINGKWKTIYIKNTWIS